MIERSRRGTTWLHRYGGLILGALVMYLAFTGAAIVFRPQLDALLYPKLLVTTPCQQSASVDTIVASARTFHPHAKPTYIYVYGGVSSSTMVRFSDADQVYLNPCTAKVLGDQQRYGGVFGAMEGLHKFKFAGETIGMAIIGSVALVLAAVLIAGGIFLWWPRRKHNWRLNHRLQGRARALNLHMTFGVYASAIVFIVAVTAVPLSLGIARTIMMQLTHSSDMTDEAPLPAFAMPAKSSGRTIPIERAWSAVRAVEPEAYQWASIHLPRGKQPIAIDIVPANAPHGEARDAYYIDATTGRIVLSRPYASIDLGSKLYYWALALHTGRAGGSVVRWLLFFGMMAVLVVGYAGIESFVRLKLRRRSLPRKATT